MTLTGRDITRIAFTLSLEPKHMLRAVDFYVQSDSIPLPDGLRDVARPLTEQGLTIIALKKAPSGQCIFLDNNLCMIHPARPGVCRAFPFTFNELEDDITWGFNAMMSICPGLGQGDEMNPSDLHITAQEVLEDIAIYRQFVMEWNNTFSSHTALSLLERILSDPRFSV